VQVTKDHVPVVYHDFIVSETGTDAPMHTITLSQVILKSLVQRASSRKSHSDLNIL